MDCSTSLTCGTTGTSTSTTGTSELAGAGVSANSSWWAALIGGDTPHRGIDDLLRERAQLAAGVAPAPDFCDRCNLALFLIVLALIIVVLQKANG